MGRSPCCTKVGLRRGPWSTKEDNLLTNYIQEHGEGQWKALPKNAGLLRCGKSCRLRWLNYLRPGIKRGNISQDEEDLIVRLHGLLGNRWSLIAGRLPGRTDNEIKNYWNTYLVKKLKNAPGLMTNKSKNKDSAKPPKTTTKKKTKKQKKVTANTNRLSGSINVITSEEQNNSIDDPTTKTKIYMPKAIKVSSVFRRTNSNDSLVSGTSSCDSAAAMDYIVPMDWLPLSELEDADYILGNGCTLPLHDHLDSMSDDVNMWEKVYDEYLQLLQ